jgi:quercetin dioxygenase-like cupin family protein
MRTLVSLLLLGCATAAAEEKVEIDNPWVRVLRIKRAAHETVPARMHPASVVVYLTAVGKHAAGEVAYFEAGAKAEENLADQPFEMVLVELKPGAPKLKSPPVTLDPVKLDPEHHPVPLENGRVRVLRTILEPRLKSPMHEHPSYVVVYLTELHTTMQLSDGKLVDNPRRPGEIAWRESMKHATENQGDKTAVEIQIELK